MTVRIRTIAILIPIYVAAIVVLQVSVQRYQLPFKEKLEMLCPLDDAHIYRELDEWGIITNIYTNCAECNSNLTAIAYACRGTAYTRAVFLCESQDIFWIGVERHLNPGILYGPYQGKLWRQTNDMNSAALTNVTLSSITIVVPLIYWLLVRPRLAAKPRNLPKATVIIG